MPLTATVPAGVVGSANFAFAKIDNLAVPGSNQLTIGGFPPGTKAISVWITEYVANGTGNAGVASFETNSVQLSNNNTEARVIFDLWNWSAPLAAAAQVIWG